MERPVPIIRCDTCAEIADRAFEGGTPQILQDAAVTFLNHVVADHPEELLALLTEKYGPVFLEKRALR